MRKEEKIKFIVNKLDDLYPKPPVPLDHKNNYELLIAVLLSAQSTDKKVNEITPALFDAAPNPNDMYKMGMQRIHHLIKQIGLANRKAEHIYKLSKILTEDFKGEVPADLKVLESLPGVGHKTASVVMAQAFGIPSFPVDTHIHRLAQRWGLTKGQSVEQTEKDLKKLFPKNKWNSLHLQMIFYGREFCSARGCYGRKCDICKTLFPKRLKDFHHRKP